MSRRSVRVGAALLAAATLYGSSVSAEVEVEVIAGHWGHHWASDGVTNERHALGCLRVDSVIGCRFDNSYKNSQGFDGETFALGYVKTWTLAEDINQYKGSIEAMGSIGLTYGYTKLGGHEHGADKKVLPYIAPAILYRQPFKTSAYWRAGFLQFGDDTVPVGTIGVTF